MKQNKTKNQENKLPNLKIAHESEQRVLQELRNLFKSWSGFLPIRKMIIKTTLKFDLIPTRMAKIKKTVSNNTDL